MGSCMLYPMHRYTCNWANADFYRFYSLRVSLIHVGNVMSSSSKARLQSCILPHVESTPLLGCPGQHGNQTETKRCQSDPDCRFSSWLTWKKPKSQTNKPKIKKIFFFLVVLSLCFAVLRGTGVSETHPLCGVFSEVGKEKLSTRTAFFPVHSDLPCQ